MKSLTLTLFAVLALVGCGKHGHELSGSERLDAHDSLGKLEKETDDLNKPLKESSDRVEKLESVKKERVAQAAAQQIIDPAQKAINDSNERIRALPEAQKEIVIQKNLTEKISGAAQVWAAFQQSKRKEHDVPARCYLDRRTMEWTESAEVPGGPPKEQPCQYDKK